MFGLFKKKTKDDDSSSHSSHHSKKVENDTRNDGSHDTKNEVLPSMLGKAKHDTLYTNNELNAKTCKELKLLAKEHEIKTSIKVDGTSRPLNKQELIDKLLLVKS